MNKAFKAIWSDVRQSFVTTSDIQSSHGKRSKVSVSLSVATVLLATSGLVSAAYVETGTLGDRASWETAEYDYNWGLGAMNASSAYALGFYGQNTTTGVMDSGAWLGNPDLDTPRITATHVTVVEIAILKAYMQPFKRELFPQQRKDSLLQKVKSSM